MSRSRSIHLTLHIHKDPAAMAERAAHHLAECCEEAIAQRGVFTLALSGGSTPLPLFRLLSSPDWAERLPWEKIIVYWGDERCVGPDDPASNYGVARRELLSHVPVTWYYRMKGEDDPVKAAQAYEDLLKEHFRLAPGEFPVSTASCWAWVKTVTPHRSFRGNTASKKKNVLSSISTCAAGGRIV